MDYWDRRSLELEPEDEIIWGENPQPPEEDDVTKEPAIPPGTKGRVIAVYDGFPPSAQTDHDATGILAWAEVEFENGETGGVDMDMQWEKISKP